LPPNPSLIIFCLRTMNSMMSYWVIFSKPPPSNK
jgi:hypothetical protein